MGQLTEVEIFDCMSDNLKLAADCCDRLAVASFRGEIYEKLRDALELIEGCCRQASTWREDTRWIPIGDLMAEVHKRAGDWLRGYKIDGEWIKTAPGELNQNFVECAKHLRSALKLVEQTKNAKTGVRGMIVPKPVQPFTRTDRKYAVKLPYAMTRGGLLVPNGAAA